MTTTTADLPLILDEVEVAGLERLSPSFLRVELHSPALAELGVDEHSYDQRIKLLFADEGRALPDVADIGSDWYAAWLAMPEGERGHLRTYTVRGTRGSGEDTRLLVDVVVHAGATGPAGRWAQTASVGDRLVLLAPRRGFAYGGIEFAPPDADRLLLVGDETAVPAVAAILEQLDPYARGAVFLEVPYAADMLTLQHPIGIAVRWLPREGGARGEVLHAAVLEHLGAPAASTEVEEADVDPDLWETPAYSSSGESVATDTAPPAPDWLGFYAWIAGESKVVTGLRRALVKDLGVDRGQVAFMGYWREGVSMG